jgi:AcrR family transcriptional regulator
VSEVPDWMERRQRSRAQRVRATRQLVVEHAIALFVERGYVQTTMVDIAASAGVAVQTLYLRFQGKPAILAAAFDHVVAGDADEVAITDRAWVADLRAAPDYDRAARLLVRNARLIVERATPLFTRIEQAAAEPEVSDLLVEFKRRKYETVGVLAQILRGKRGFGRRVSLARTTDVLYAVGSEELFRLLCLERGWSSAQWEDFMLSVMAREFGHDQRPKT